MRMIIPLLTILPVSLSNLSSRVSFNLANQPPIVSKSSSHKNNHSVVDNFACKFKQSVI